MERGDVGRDVGGAATHRSGETSSQAAAGQTLGKLSA